MPDLPTSNTQAEAEGLFTPSRKVKVGNVHLGIAKSGGPGILHIGLAEDGAPLMGAVALLGVDDITGLRDDLTRVLDAWSESGA